MVGCICIGPEFWVTRCTPSLSVWTGPLFDSDVYDTLRTSMNSVHIRTGIDGCISFSDR